MCANLRANSSNVLTSGTSTGNPIVTVQIHDGGGSFGVDTVTLTTAADVIPIANAGYTWQVEVGQLVTLNGTRSYDPGTPPQPLTFLWTQVSGPAAVTLMLLSGGIVIDVIRRFLFGSEPLGAAMVGFSVLSLFVNVAVLRMLAQFREGEVHMRASWICTRADVVANFGVLVSGLVVFATGWRYADLLVGVAIATYVAKGGARNLAAGPANAAVLSER